MKTVAVIELEPSMLLETVIQLLDSVFVGRTSSLELVKLVELEVLLFKKETFSVAQTVDVMLEDQSMLSVTNTMDSALANQRSKEESATSLFRLTITRLCINISTKLKTEEQSPILLLDSVTMSLFSQTTLGEDMPVSRTS